jgi:1-acyl-sn-glycerol-3-phosphate acyltransferase
MLLTKHRVLCYKIKMSTIKKIKQTLVSIVIYLVAGTWFSLGAILLIAVSIVHTGAVFEGLVKFVCRGVIFLAGIRVNASGLENCTPGKQYIIMMNHVNIFDAMVFYSRFPGKARGLEEISHFKWFLYGWLIKRIGIIPIDRTSGLKAITSLKKAGQLIKDQSHFSIAILPEGTRTLTGKLGNFKKGGFLLALETGLEILPIIQSGSFRIKKKNHWLIKPGKINLVFEKPIPVAGYTKDNLKELLELTRTLFLKYLE